MPRTLPVRPRRWAMWRPTSSVPRPTRSGGRGRQRRKTSARRPAAWSASGSAPDSPTRSGSWCSTTSGCATRCAGLRSTADTARPGVRHAVRSLDSQPAELRLGCAIASARLTTGRDSVPDARRHRRERYCERGDGRDHRRLRGLLRPTEGQARRTRHRDRGLLAQPPCVPNGGARRVPRRPGADRGVLRRERRERLERPGDLQAAAPRADLRPAWLAGLADRVDPAAPSERLPDGSRACRHRRHRRLRGVRGGTRGRIHRSAIPERDLPAPRQLLVGLRQSLRRLVLMDSVGVDIPGLPIRDFFALDARGVADYSFHDGNRFYVDPTEVPAEQLAARQANMATMRVLAGHPYMHDSSMLGRLGEVSIPTLVLWGARSTASSSSTRCDPTDVAGTHGGYDKHSHLHRGDFGPGHDLRLLRKENAMAHGPVSDTRVLLDGFGMGESPRWHEGRLWFSNWGTNEIVAVDFEGNNEVIGAGGGGSGWAVNWLRDGRMLVTGGELLRIERDGSRVRHADLRDVSPYGWSEITVDGRGNAYVNSLNFDFADFTNVH